jgi:hypothetical protein
MTDPTPATATAPAGWYPDTAPDASVGRERYWDGTVWTEQYRWPQAAPAVATEPLPPIGKPKRKMPLWGWIAIGVAVLIILISSIANAGNKDDATPNVDPQLIASDPPQNEPSEEPVDTRVEVPDMVGMTVAEAVAALQLVNITLDLGSDVGQDWIVTSQTVAGGQKIEPGDPLSISAEAPKPTLTLAQENAVESAQSYLNYSGFSRAGLIGQLTSEYGEGYAPADAEFAVKYLEQQKLVDWNAEAVESAKSYLEYSSFSKQGLFEQLTSEYGEGFTPDQANYALSKVGY